jgi:hypothetical protein
MLTAEGSKVQPIDEANAAFLATSLAERARTSGLGRQSFCAKPVPNLVATGCFPYHHDRVV